MTVGQSAVLKILIDQLIDLCEIMIHKSLQVCMCMKEIDQSREIAKCKKKFQEKLRM